VFQFLDARIPERSKLQSAILPHACCIIIIIISDYATRCRHDKSLDSDALREEQFQDTHQHTAVWVYLLRSDVMRARSLLHPK
jgi:hypothetical protein